MGVHLGCRSNRRFSVLRPAFFQNLVQPIRAPGQVLQSPPVVVEDSNWRDDPYGRIVTSGEMGVNRPARLLSSQTRLRSKSIVMYNPQRVFQVKTMVNEIIQRSCESMPEIASESVALTVTSPPYWNAIDYDIHAENQHQN